MIAQIQKEKKDFEDNDVTIVEGFNFNQLETIKTIISYYNSRFRDGQFYADDEYKDQRKYFHNLNRSPCDNATKNIDIDTKDVYPVARREKDYVKASILRHDLTNYMKVHKVGQIKNRIEEEAPIFGTVVVKEVPGDDILQIVDLRNIICDPTCDKLEDSFVIEKHYYTPQELKKMPWKNIKEAIEKHTQYQIEMGDEEQDTVAPYIEVFERYGEVPKADIEEANGRKPRKSEYNEYQLARFIVAGIQGEEEEGVILDASRVKKIPYKEYRYNKIKGRWLGEGEVEKNFDPQIRINELTNYKMQGMRLSTLHLFVSPDETLEKNVLSDCDNGDIIRAPNGIQPLVNEERNLAAYNQEEQRIDQLVANLSNSYEVVRGETMPAGTPFRSVAVQNMNAAKLFDFKRENLVLFWKELYREVVIPRLIKNLKEEHIVDIAESAKEYESFVDDVVRHRTWEAIQKMIAKGIDFRRGQLDMIKQAIKRKLMSQKIKVPENYYDNLEYDVDINISGERYNKAALLESKFNLLKLIMQGGTESLQDPTIKNLVDEIAELSGTSPLEIGESSPTNQQAQSSAMVRQMGMQGAGGAMGTTE